VKTLAHTLAVSLLALIASGCAASLRNPNIADVTRDAGHYANRTVTIEGTVTNAWEVPLVPFTYYKVEDGTGEMAVLSRSGSRTPVKGSHVRVKGVVRDIAVLGGQPLGLHLEERSLEVKRH
jgi:hypothetical protein